MKPSRSVGLHLFTLAGVLGAVSCAGGADPEPFASPEQGAMPGGGGLAYGGSSNGGVFGASGSTQLGSAGATANGGSTFGSGGALGAGGTTSSAGTTSNGGTTPNAGGTGAAGGTTSTGGAAQCTDEPPPNGDTCAHAVLYKWCGADWMNGTCAASCGLCTGGATGAGGAGGGTSSTGGASPGSGGAPATGGTFGAGGATQPPPIQGGQTGWASRYWDCCKPACGWKANVQSGNPMSSCDQGNQSLGGNYDATNACDGGNAFMCWSGAPWSVSDTLSYGFAAVTGSNYVCGRCYQLQFSGSGHSGNNAGAVALNGKTMIVQVINNGGVGGDQFDLLIPGGGVGDRNACTTQWGSSADLGAQFGGYLTECNGNTSCVKQKCDTVFAGKPDLQAGCDWFLGWFQAADNPNLVFAQIACPAAITQRSGLSDPG